MTGWRVPSVHWTGVQLSDILDLAGVKPAGKALAFHSFDGADTESLTLDQARRPDVIVAYEMLGAPVTRDHGGPVRLYVAPDVRLQVAQVARRHRGHQPGHPRLLGAERLRRRRLDRGLQWPRRHARHLTAGRPAARPAAALRPGRAGPALGQRHADAHRAGHRLGPVRPAALRAGGPAPAGRSPSTSTPASPCPFPLLLTLLAGRWGAGLRADARRLNRWTPDDRRWLRTRGPATGRVPLGKFNAGQKLNAAFTVGAIVVMLATGLIMRFPNEWPLSWRTGATFVHDWVYLAAAIVVTGHILFAVNDRRLAAQHGRAAGSRRLGPPPRPAVVRGASPVRAAGGPPTGPAGRPT